MSEELLRLEHRLAHLESMVEKAQAQLTAGSIPTSEPSPQGQAVPAPLKVVGRSGRLLVEIDEDENGAFLHLFGADGHSLISITEGPSGARIELRNQFGKTVVLVGADLPGGGGVAVCDPSGRTAVGLASRPAGGLLVIYDSQGTPSFCAPVGS